MSSANRRAAMGALDRARPLVLGLRSDRQPADLSRDLVESWNHTEVALRSLLGGSALGGPALVRELSVRGLLTMEQAHQLVDFHAARGRAELPEYQPQEYDLEAARRGFAELDRGLLQAEGAERATAAFTPPPGSGSAPAAAPPSYARPASAPATAESGAAAPRGRGLPSWLVLVLAIVLVVAIAAAGYWAWANRASGPRRLAAAEQLYASGDRDRARLAFAEIAKANPQLALPHLYLGRIAREQQEWSVANQELSTAIRLDPTSALAQREMGALMFATGNYDLARRFYIRAVQMEPNDRTAQGYLGCTLARLGRTTEAARFVERAGPGPWTACLGPAGVPPGALPGTAGGPIGAPRG
jgi:tetratricopeptide (TPR) repeat protein